MPFKNRLFLFGLLVLLAALLAIVFAPVAVSNGLRLWVWWKSRQEGLTVSIDKIDAPFLQPVVIRSFHVKSVRADALHYTRRKPTEGLGQATPPISTSGYLQFQDKRHSRERHFLQNPLPLNE